MTKRKTTKKTRGTAARLPKLRTKSGWCYVVLSDEPFWCGPEGEPASVLLGLEAVEALEPDDFETHDNAPREAVAWSVVEKTLPFIPKPLDTVIRLLWFTGARPSEILRLTVGDIDRSD